MIEALLRLQKAANHWRTIGLQNVPKECDASDIIHKDLKDTKNIVTVIVKAYVRKKEKVLSKSCCDL